MSQEPLPTSAQYPSSSMEGPTRRPPGPSHRQTLHTTNPATKTPPLPPQPYRPVSARQPSQLRPPNVENPLARRPSDPSSTVAQISPRQEVESYTPSKLRYSDPGQSPMEGKENEGKSYFGSPCMSYNNHRSALEPRAYNQPDPMRASSLPSPSFADVNWEKKKKGPLTKFKSTFSSMFKKDDGHEKVERVESKHWTDEDY